ASGSARSRDSSMRERRWRSKAEMSSCQPATAGAATAKAIEERRAIVRIRIIVTVWSASGLRRARLFLKRKLFSGLIPQSVLGAVFGRDPTFQILRRRHADRIVAGIDEVDFAG